MRVGLLGGSFNPPHRGHVAIALAVRDAMELDEVLLIPASRPPHKPSNRDMASPQDRLTMAERAAADREGLGVSDIELRRQGPSYTIDTIAALKAERPEATFFWIIGADTIGELPTWKRAEELVREVAFVAVNRPGYDTDRGLAALFRKR